MLKDYFDQHINGKRPLLYVLLLLLVICVFAMRYFDSFLINDIATYGILSFELAKELVVSEAILNSWTEVELAATGLSLGFDFIFIIVYASFIALLIYNINQRLWKSHLFYHVGRFMIWSIYLAALFDIVENIALIQLVLGNLNQIWSSTAYYLASIKFVIILSCIFYILSNWLILLANKLIK